MLLVIAQISSAPRPLGAAREDAGQSTFISESVIRLLTTPSFGLYFCLLFNRLFSPANVKEATAMHPPDGSLAPLAGAEGFSV